MAARKASTLAALALVTLASGCLDQRLGRGDRYRAIRGDSPPRPAAALQIPTPPRTAPVAAKNAVQPAVHITAPEANAIATTAVQPASFTQPASNDAPAASSLRQVYEKAVTRWAGIDSYIVRLTRREVIGGKAQPEEMMLVKFRKEPYSIYFKWIGAEAKGREVVYVKGRYDNKINTLTSGGEFLLVPAGMVFKADLDSPMVKARCRYPITEADLGSTVKRFGRLLNKVEANDLSWGALRHGGQVQRPEYPRPVEDIVQTVPPKGDPNLPAGGERHWYFDTDTGLPLLIVTTDPTGREVEYYCHDRLIAPAGLVDDDFDPDKLWKKKS